MPSGFSGATAILGIGVVFESNSPEAVEAALEVFPVRSDGSGMMPAAPVYVVLAIDHAKHSPNHEHRISEGKLHITQSDFAIEADGRRGCANCAFGGDVIGTDLFREVVHTASLFLVAQRDRTPIHASAIMIRDCAVILAGQSGSGKSTLALAAHSTGLPVVAEDTVFVQLDPALKVWGLCDRIHIFERDAPPGMQAQTRLRSGKMKFAVPVRRAQLSAGKAALCVLVGGDRVGLEPVSLERAVHILTSDLEPGFDFYGKRTEEAVRSIAAGGCWQLTLSRDPAAAIATLSEGFGAADPEHLSHELHHV